MNGPTPDREPPFAAIVFDCDSTLSAIEGIDELATGETRAEVAALTDRAMAGELALEDVYGARLARIAPTRADVDALSHRYLEHALEGARETVQQLRGLGKVVAVISGGLHAAVLPFAVELGVAPELVFAVGMRFHDDGTYAGFDEDSPLARADGKPEVVARLAQEHGPVALVGDGTTDLATAGTAARFVAFCGVVERPQVVQAARHVVREPRLDACLLHLLTADELDALDR